MKPQLLTLLLICSTFCSAQTFSKAWESDSLFLKPESALYDSSVDLIYISNINGEYLAKDGNGFISRIHTDGTIESLKWVEGLDNPQGLGLYRNNLYVADINRVVQIDTKTAKIEHVYKADSAKFLNDIAADKNGDIYISDCFGNKIYKITAGKIEIWLAGSFLSGPNGLLCTDKEILVLNMNDNCAYAVNKKDKKFRKIFDGIANQDGITSYGNNGYYVSGAWQGQIFHVDAHGNKKLIIDLGKEKMIAADIQYLADKQLLLVPTLYKTVIGYKIDNE